MSLHKDSEDHEDSRDFASKAKKCPMKFNMNFLDSEDQENVPHAKFASFKGIEIGFGF